tara:strand:+ start:284 stop:958 length:675 start_codon:yes stop_codon:yes gene_type:complete
MNVRLRNNTNLSLHTASHYQEHTVQLQHGPLIADYLESISQVFHNAISEHSRTLAIRIDLRLPNTIKCPDYPFAYGNSIISKFTASLKAQLKAHQLKKQSMGKRAIPCTLRYVWVNERDSVLNDHYHMVLFFNKDAYDRLGDIRAIEGNMAARIKKAWASALDLELRAVTGLVHFTRNGVFHLDSNSEYFNQNYNNCFEACSYLAKAKTKHYGSRMKSFGCSRA